MADIMEDDDTDSGLGDSPPLTPGYFGNSSADENNGKSLYDPISDTLDP